MPSSLAAAQSCLVVTVWEEERQLVYSHYLHRAEGQGLTVWSLVGKAWESEVETFLGIIKAKMYRDC